MIKKKLKTLGDLNPTFKPSVEDDGTVWRIHLEDGFIDVRGVVERDRKIRELFETHNFPDNTINMTLIDAPQQFFIGGILDASFGTLGEVETTNIEPDEYYEIKTLKQLIKKDFSKWSWWDLLIVPKVWKLLSYITAFTKLSIFIFLFITLSLTVGLINESVTDKICEFLGKMWFTERENEIMKITFGK